MPSYNFFSQPKGPDIDTDLFPKAAEQGAETQRITGTPFSNAVQGLEQGLGVGEGLVQDYQNSEIKQNAINQQPVTNDIQQQEDKRLQLENQVRALDTQAVTDNSDLYLRDKKAQLEQQTLSTEDKVKDLKNKDDIDAILASGDSQDINGIYQNSSLLGTLLRDPEYADRTLGAASNHLTPDNFSTGYKALGFSKYQSYQLKQAQINSELAKNFYNQQAKSEVKLPASFNVALNDYDPKNPAAMFEPGGVQVVQKGSLAYDANNQLLPGITGIPQPLDKSDPNAAYPYALYSKGKLVSNAISKQDADAYNGQRANYQYQKSIAGRLTYGPSFSGVPGIPSVNGIQGPGIISPTPTPTATPDVSNAAPQAQATPVAAPLPIPANQNADIVAQKNAAFKQLSLNPPVGIPKGTLEQQYQSKLDAIRQGSGLLMQNKLAAQGINTSVATTASANAQGAPAPTPTIAPAPSTALSQVMKQNVDFTFAPQAPVHSTVYNSINSNPLLTDASPLFKGLVANESGGNTQIKSPTGVVGLAQVTQRVANSYGLNRDIPADNVKAGQLYLYDMLTTFKGNLSLGLAAYNAGPGTIGDAVKEAGSTDWNVVKPFLKAIVSPAKWKEVENYPERVLTYASQFLGSGGDSDLNLTYQMQQNGLIKPKQSEI